MFSTTRWADVHPTRSSVPSHWMEREFDEHVHGPIGKALSLMVDQVDEEHAGSASPFWIQDPPWFPIEDYVGRIKQYVDTSSETFIVALLYMDRLALANKANHVSVHNVHRLVLASFVLAHKYYDEVTKYMFFTCCSCIHSPVFFFHFPMRRILRPTAFWRRSVESKLRC